MCGGEAELAGRGKESQDVEVLQKTAWTTLAPGPAGTCPVLQAGVCISPLGELTSASLG